MIRTMLLDDEPRGLSSLRKMLELHCPDLEIVAECLYADQALEIVSSVKPQLIFLDVAMPGKNGFDFLNELTDIPFEIIFVTAYSEYSIRAFQYSAVDYLLKPVDETLLIQAVKRAITRISNHTVPSNMDTFLFNMQKMYKPAEMKLCISSQKGFQVIRLADILFCEAESSYTIFHMLNGHALISSRPILDYELLLEDNFFCRIHKSYFINLIHVKEYRRGEGGSVILSNGREVEVSRRKKEVFLARMKELFKM